MGLSELNPRGEEGMRRHERESNWPAWIKESVRRAQIIPPHQESVDSSGWPWATFFDYGAVYVQTEQRDPDGSWRAIVWELGRPNFSATLELESLSDPWWAAPAIQDWLRAHPPFAYPPVRRNSDEGIRRLERLAAAGDPSARAQLDAARKRAGVTIDFPLVAEWAMFNEISRRYPGLIHYQRRSPFGIWYARGDTIFHEEYDPRTPRAPGLELIEHRWGYSLVPEAGADPQLVEAALRARDKWAVPLALSDTSMWADYLRRLRETGVLPPPAQTNPDERMRRLERLAAAGDPEAAARLQAARERVAPPRPAESFMRIREGDLVRFALGKQHKVIHERIAREDPNRGIQSWKIDLLGEAIGKPSPYAKTTTPEGLNIPGALLLMGNDTVFLTRPGGARWLLVTWLDSRPQS